MTQSFLLKMADVSAGDEALAVPPGTEENLDHTGKIVQLLK